LQSREDMLQMRDRHVGNLSIPVIESGIVADNGVHSGKAEVAQSNIWCFDCLAWSSLSIPVCLWPARLLKKSPFHGRMVEATLKRYQRELRDSAADFYPYTGVR
jgi:hypothetical protein